jgi:signal transduction histidine kinase
VPQAPPGPRLYRSVNRRALAGVAGGIAEHLRVPVLAVRIAFLALLAAYGLGAILYAAFWAVLPVDRATPPRKRDVGQLVALGALGIGTVAVASNIGVGSAALLLSLLVALIAVGAGVIWHQADPDRRRRAEESGATTLKWFARGMGDRRGMVLRFSAGLTLVAVGIIGVIAVASGLSDSNAGSAVVDGLIFSLVAVAGFTAVFGPMFWRSVRELSTEREARVRETERAEIAAMVHDQVLHTLALIQRNSQDSREVQRLARGQERTLRNWLYKPTASATEKFSPALEAAAAEVEDSFAISVDTVVVGDCDVDADVAALVAAAREAMVNAGKHADVETISLYAEVEPAQLSVFVRDRGVGFDPTGVSDDRHGVAGSIIGRMERHGGKAEIISTPGEGTEIRLYLPRTGSKGEPRD